MMTPEQVEDFKRFLADKLSERDAQIEAVAKMMRALTEQCEEQAAGDQQDERLTAVARAVTRLADGLSTAEKSRRASYEEIKGALIEMLGVSGDSLAILRDDLSQLTAEELADILSHSVVCEVRTIQYHRGEANRTSENTPARLPPVEAVVAVAAPASSVTVDEDDSIVFHTQKDGKAHIRANIKAKTLLGWVAGLVMAGLYLYEKLKPLLGHH